MNYSSGLDKLFNFFKNPLTLYMSGPPPGVVMFPSGNMLLTESGVSRNKPWCGSLKYASSPGGVNPSGIHIAGRFGFSQEQIDQLRQEFPWIRMKFPVRCKMPVSFSLLFSSFVNIFLRSALHCGVPCERSSRIPFCSPEFL